MKRLMCLCVFLSISLLIQPVFADADAFSLSILRSVEMNSDFGAPVDTFEDVEPITGIHATFANNGPIIGQNDLSTKFQSFSERRTVDEFFDLLTACGGLIFETGNLNFAKFLAKHFYMDSGHTTNDEATGERIWHDQKAWPKPDLTFADYANTANPHERVYNLCLDAVYQYIEPFEKPEPNAISCEVHRQFCQYPPCERDSEEEDPASAGVMLPVLGSHDVTIPNIYKALEPVIKDHLVDASPVIENESGIEFKMIFKDRTPPRIDGCVDGDFPELGADKPATSGDWYKVEGLKISDNSGGKIGTALMMGKIDTSPGVTWATEEKWILEKPNVIESGSNADHIVMPNSCHGVMRYTVYAWDKHGNLNPGDPNIREDDPEYCYGLGHTVVGDANVGFDGNNIDLNLSTDPGQAREWPIKVEFRKEEDFDDTYLDELKAKLNSDFRRGQGYINIEDNDLPNIVIRIESVKDGSRIFFPPVIPHGESGITIVQSTKYKASSAPADMNVADYVEFLGLAKGKPYTSIELADGSQEQYFRILDVFPSDVMHPAEKDILINKYKTQPDPDFIRQHFRLEDFSESDTKDTDGSPALDPSTFGSRNSYGRRVVALLELPGNKAMIQEDVEYLIDVWTDDNIKWATVDSSGQKLDSIIGIPTGVQNGEIIVEIPNQHPRATYRVPLDSQESVNGKLRVVFREPTPDIGGADEDELISKRFPFIDVRATDYSGLERSIRLYIRITNENPNIRVLDRKHEKNR